MKYKFSNPQFLTTVVKPDTFPKFNASAEIATVGRSNVGKSSLLNHLFKSKNLVKTSSTPGKTQAINFFSLNDALIFADLPGYGYAKVPISQRKKWKTLIESYLNRPSLILFLLDIRHTPSVEDQIMWQWIKQSQIPTILVLTKADKIKPSSYTKQTQNIFKIFNDGENPPPYVHYSVVKNEGRNQLINLICEALVDTFK